MADPAMLFRILLAQKQCSPFRIIGGAIERRAVLLTEEFCLHRRRSLHGVEKVL